MEINILLNFYFISSLPYFRGCYGESSLKSFDSSHCLYGEVFSILLHSAETYEIFSLTPMFLKAKLQLDISVFWCNVLDTPWAISIWQFRLSHFVGNFFPFPSFFLLFSLFGEPISWLYQRNYYSWFSYLFIASFYLWICCSAFWKSPLLNRLMLLLSFSFLLLLCQVQNFFGVIFIISISQMIFFTCWDIILLVSSVSLPMVFFSSFNIYGIGDSKVFVF